VIETTTVHVSKACFVQPEHAAVGEKRKKGSSSKGSKKAKTSTKTPTQALVPLIKGELRSYQLKGVSWLISLWTNGMNGILADQMGLGKTVQTIAFLSHLRENGIMGPFLIVVPLSTLVNWKEEVYRWCPSMSAIIYHGTKADRQAIEQQWFKPAYNRARLHLLHLPSEAQCVDQHNVRCCRNLCLNWNALAHFDRWLGCVSRAW
jgi:ATP-dependent DNA helicase